MEELMPEWLDESFLSKCLIGELQDEKKIEITQFRGVPAVAAGNNYGSNLFRVTLDYKEDSQEKTISLIVKCPIEKGPRAELLEPFIDVESKFYYSFLPLASQLSTDNFTPRSYYSSMKSVVVLEDLKLQGYIMADRLAQLDFDHCHLYTVTSAAFHAVSVAVQKVDPQLIEEIGKEKMFSRNDEAMYNFNNMVLQHGCQCATEYMEKTEFKKYAALLRQSSNTLLDQIIEARQPSKILNCLTQGDPWVTNMMFKYDESGKVSSLKLLDFQALTYCSPINDLVFFLWSSAKNDVRENRCDELFRSYHSTLNSKLKELKCTEYLSYEELMKNVEMLSPLMFLIAFGYMPQMLNKDVLDIDDLMSRAQDKVARQENKFSKYFTEDYCKNFLSRHLKQLENMGAFKYLESYQRKQ